MGDQAEFASLVESEDFLTVADHAPIFAVGTSDPSFFACLQIDASESLVAEVHVQVMIDHDRRGHVTFELVVPPGRGSTTLNVEQERSSSVAAGKNTPVPNGWSENIHSAERCDLIAPKLRSTLEIDTGKVSSGLNEQLTLSVDVGDHG